VSRLLQAYIIGWAFVLGMLVIGGSSGGQSGAWVAFIYINQQPANFAATAIFVWLFYSVPCVVIFAVGFFIVRASRRGKRPIAS
jgi:hypothetical protein